MSDNKNTNHIKSAPLTIDELVTLAKQTPETERIETLWRAVFVRKAWYLLPAKKGETTPLVIDTSYHDYDRTKESSNEEKGIILPIFTSFRKIDRFAKSQGIIQPGEALETLVLSPYEAMLKIREVANYLTFISFNMGGLHSFRATPKLLDIYAEHFNVFDFNPDNI